MAVGTKWFFDEMVYPSGGFVTEKGAWIIPPWHGSDNYHRHCAHTLLDEKGELEVYAWPGGYEIYYFDREGSVLCARCASNNVYSEPVVSYGIIEEGCTYCDNCSKPIGDEEQQFEMDAEGEAE